MQVTVEYCVAVRLPGYPAPWGLAQQLHTRGVRILPCNSLLRRSERQWHEMYCHARRAAFWGALLLVLALCLAALLYSYTLVQVRPCLMANAHVPAEDLRANFLLPLGQGGIYSYFCRDRLYFTLRLQDRWRSLHGLPALTGPLCSVLAPVPYYIQPPIPGC